jgi:TolB protein
MADAVCYSFAVVELRKYARASPWKFAGAILTATTALRCGSSADFPSGEAAEIEASGAGGAAESRPPVSGVAGTDAAPPSSIGVAGPTASPPEVSLAPTVMDAGVDAGVAPSADCALGAFQAPEPLTGLEQGLDPDAQLSLWSPSLSPDGLTLFFAVSVDGGDELIATATRQDGGSAFSPGVSADGLSLYFFSTREGGLGRRDVWRAARPALAADFAAPTLVAGINGPDDDHLPWLSPDELTMLWETNRPGGVGGFDIWIARRAFRSDGFSNIAPLNGVNGASTDGRAVLSRDELTIYFTSERPDGMGRLDLWLAARSTREDSFSQLTNLASLNSSGLDQDPFLSADERELMFASDRDGQMRLWRSVRVCE